MGRPEVPGPLQLARVDVHRDDRPRPGQPGAEHRGVAHPAAPDHGDRITQAHRRGVDRGTESRHHAAAEQARHLGRGRRVDLGALSRGDQRLLHEGADAQGGGEGGAVGQGHLLGRVVGVEAVPGPATLAGAALAADRAPVQDDEVARRDAGHVVADRLDHPGRLVPEQVGEIVADATVAIVQIGVADAAGLHPHQGLTGSGIGHQHGYYLDWSTLTRGDDAPHLSCHPPIVPNLQPNGTPG